MTTSITLFKTGLSISSQFHSHFINFKDLSISGNYDVPVDLESNPPIGSDLQVAGIIGLVELCSGYLILIDNQVTVFEYDDVKIWRILHTLVIPLKYDLCKSYFGVSDDVVPVMDEPDQKKILVDQMKKNKDILFSKLGIYADDLKSSASLLISKKPAQPSFSDNNYTADGDDGLDPFFSNEDSSDGIADNVSTEAGSIRMKRSITLRGPISKGTPGKQSTNKDISKSMTGKFEKQLKGFFNSKDFYYSDEIDLTKNVGFLKGKIINEVADENNFHGSGNAFWYNKYLTKRFQNLNNSSTRSKPEFKKIIQGFVNSIDIPLNLPHISTTKQSKLLLVSKRSIKRPGLRYLRRGIDDDSNVANFVHTSQIFIMEDYKLLKDSPSGLFCKFDLIRGSIPLFFNQNPSNLKPVPYLTKSLDNVDTPKAFSTHFKRLEESYGDISCISLVERSKKEETVGQPFVEMCDKFDVKISWFDFHKVCSGMKFDNVVQLLDSKFNLSDTTVEQQMLNDGYYDSISNQRQTGIFRVNCIDCLDRTNLVSKFISEYQLTQLIFIKYNLSPIDMIQFNKDFNNLWADNGDFISRQYASTNALKGDYTRTSKRNYKGLMQDAWLTMNRYYSGYISDYFKQCVIEFLIGVKGKEVFLEFERSFSVKDTNVGNKFEENKRRTTIIEELKLNDTSVSHVVLVGIWHGFESPLKLNELRLDNNKERKQNNDIWVVLTNKSIHFITFDSEDEILDIIKLDNEEITGLQYGVYFKNGAGGHHIESLAKKPENNIGMKFILPNLDVKSKKSNESEASESGDVVNDTQRFLAVKFPQDMDYATVKHVINLISKTLTSSCYLEGKDILTLKDASKLNSFNDFVDGIEYKFKKLIWG